MLVGIALGLLYQNAGEWMVHKHVLHGAGRRRKSFWRFHWHEHHREARLHGFRDPNYERPIFAWHAQSKEAVGLLAAGLVHLPLLPIAPFFTGAYLYGLARYYRVHKRAHLDPEWAREHLPWHYDHHMGPNQDANWCVTRPWFDVLMGTRIPYAGTAQEATDLERRRRAKERQPPPGATPAIA